MKIVQNLKTFGVKIVKSWLVSVYDKIFHFWHMLFRKHKIYFRTPESFFVYKTTYVGFTKNKKNITQYYLRSSRPTVL